MFTVGLFRVLHPVVQEFTELYTRRTGEVAVCVITVVYIVGFCLFLQLPLSICTSVFLHGEQALDQMRAELLVQAREKMENLEESSGLSRDRIKKQLENKLGRLMMLH